MIWRFERKEHRVYLRNPLDTVVAQLRFQPILKIGAGQRIADFQDLIRAAFPGYGEGEIKNLTVSPDAQVTTKVEKVFHFLRPEDDSKVQLSSDNVLVEAKHHKCRDDLRSDLTAVVDALNKVYAPIKAKRFGVRYINIIDPEIIGQGLGRSVTLKSLINSEYLAMPARAADLDRTLFANQITSPMGLGSLTLRYGIPPPKSPSSSTFTFDIDRYVESEIELSEIGNILTQFTDDIFSLFNTLPGIDLMEWMSKQGNSSKSGGVH